MRPYSSGGRVAALGVARLARRDCASWRPQTLIWFDWVLDVVDHQHVARQPQLAGLWD